MRSRRPGDADTLGRDDAILRRTEGEVPVADSKVISTFPARPSDVIGPFRVDARMFEGSLAAPVRNETRRRECSDYVSAVGLAHSWQEDGFTVWIYDHGRTTGLANASDLRVIAVVHPSGEQSAPPRH